MSSVAVHILLSFCLLVFASPASARQPLSVRTTDEEVPPGGVLQVKLEVTEPKPISTGGGHLRFGAFDEFLGIAVNSVNHDAAAVVVARPEGLTVRFVSPTATLGLEPDYPLLTLTMRVPATARIGERASLDMTEVQFLDPSGAPYETEFKAGEAIVANVPAVTTVIPGSAALPAGSVVTIQGVGFQPSTRVRFEETALASVEVVSSSLIRVITSSPVVMHGMGVELRNDNARSTYFSYQRTTPIGRSAHPLFAVAEAAFPAREWTNAMVRFDSPSSNIMYGLAFQNLGGSVAVAKLQLLDASGAVTSQVSLTMPPNARVVRTLSEVFANVCVFGQTCWVRLESAAPLQVLGIAGNLSDMSATPLMPSDGGITPAVLALTTSLNAAIYRVGDVIAVEATEVAGPQPVNADAYVVLQTPGGGMMSLTPGGLVPGIFPLMRNVDVRSNSRLVLRAAIPPGTLPGPYTWLSALAVPGTLNLLSPIASTSFTVRP